MELMMWIVVGILASLGLIVLVPLLVVGSWFVVMTVILGLADGAIWLLDQGWKKGKRTLLSRVCLPEYVDAEGGARVPRVTVRNPA